MLRVKPRTGILGSIHFPKVGLLALWDFINLLWSNSALTLETFRISLSLPIQSVSFVHINVIDAAQIFLDVCTSTQAWSIWLGATNRVRAEPSSQTRLPMLGFYRVWPWAEDMHDLKCVESSQGSFLARTGSTLLCCEFCLCSHFHGDSWTFVAEVQHTQAPWRLDSWLFCTFSVFALFICVSLCWLLSTANRHVSTEWLDMHRSVVIMINH